MQNLHVIMHWMHDAVGCDTPVAPLASSPAVVLNDFKELKQFVRETAHSGRGLIAYIG